MLEAVWAGIYSCLSMVLLVSALACGFYLVGRAFFALLRVPCLESSSVTIAVGLSMTLFMGWYAYRLGIPLSQFVVAGFLFVIAICVFKLAVRLRKIRQVGLGAITNNLSTIYVFPVVAAAFSVQAIFAFQSPSHLVGTLGNNDLYDWSLLAEYLLGSAGYSNIYTTLGGSAQQYRIDSFGTFFTLAIVAKFIGKSALEATPTFTILSMSFIGLAIFDLVKRLFGFKDVIVLGVALLVSAGAFFFYLAYNNFYGQLLATFLYIAIVCLVFHLAGVSQHMNFVRRSVLVAVPIIGILISYSPGVFVFSIFSIVFCVTYGFVSTFKRNSLPTAVRSAVLLVYPMLFGILLALVLLPELAIYTAHRTIEVKDVINGWPLPLVSPAYLLSISFKPFPGAAGNLIYYIIAIGVIAFVLVCVYSVAQRQNTTFAANYAAFAVFFGTSMGAYLLAFFFKGDIYQVWKLGAFVVLPMSFMFLSATFFSLNNANAYVQRVRAPILAAGCIIVLVVIPTMSKLHQNSNQIEQIKAAKFSLRNSGIENVIIDSMDFGETMVAFNVLSDEFKLFPLSKSYVAPVEISVIKGLDPVKTRMLVNAKCYSEVNGANVGGYKIINFGESATGWGKHHFNSGDAVCEVAHGVYLKSGFSVIESWGTWTDGKNAKVQVSLPTVLSGKAIRASFDVHPYGAEQTVSAKINGVPAGSWTVKQATALNFEIPAKPAESRELEFEFFIENPIRPKDLDPASSDTRSLGLGFLAFSMSAEGQ